MNCSNLAELYLGKNNISNINCLYKLGNTNLKKLSISTIFITAARNFIQETYVLSRLSFNVRRL